MSENIEWPQDPPQDGDQITIGNTTFAWNPDPGIWVGFVNATTESGSGGGATGFANAWGADGSAPTVVTGNQTITGAAAGTFFYVEGITIAGGVANINSTPATPALTNTSGNSWQQRIVEGRQGQATNVAGSSGWRGFIASGDTLVTNSTNTSYRIYTWDAVAAAGGSSTTVNIGGGGGSGIQLGNYTQQDITTTGPIALDGSGPAWVYVTGGGGSGGAAVRSFTGSQNPVASNGGNAGMFGFFLEDVSVLEGASFTAGVGGAQAIALTSSNSGASQNGNAGTASTLTTTGFTITCTGGGGGQAFSGGGTVTPGAAGTATATGADVPTEVALADLRTDAQAYWMDFIIATSAGNITLASASVSFGGGTGGLGRTLIPTSTPTSTNPVAVASTAGGIGQLQIVYQNQT